MNRILKGSQSEASIEPLCVRQFLAEMRPAVVPLHIGPSGSVRLPPIIRQLENLPQRVILIDGNRLAELMIEHNVGVSRAYAYEIKRIDSDYFEES